MTTAKKMTIDTESETC